MAKPRVDELAKELGLDCRVIRSALEDMGEYVRSDSSTIEPPVARRLRERFAASAAKGLGVSTGATAPTSFDSTKDGAGQIFPAARPGGVQSVGKKKSALTTASRPDVQQSRNNSHSSIQGSGARRGEGETHEAKERLVTEDQKRVLWSMVQNREIPVKVVDESRPRWNAVLLPFCIFNPDAGDVASSMAKIRRFDKIPRSPATNWMVCRILKWSKDDYGPGYTLLADFVRWVDEDEYKRLADIEVVRKIKNLFQLERASEDVERERAENQRMRADLTLLERETQLAREEVTKREAEVMEQGEELKHRFEAIRAAGYLKVLEEDSDEHVDSADVVTTLTSTLTERLKSMGLVYEARIVRRTLIAHCLAACLGQIIVYAGPPGSGKTTLATKLPELLGMEANTVPVHPGWLDAMDLQGFRDPSKECFYPTPFLELVKNVEADDKQRHHVIVLDEMNIARIENYGADWLSQLEKAHEGNSLGKLRLWAPRWVLGEGGKEDAKKEEGVLEIPKKLILAGTLNHDETTERLSPKVLSRALVIRVPWQEPTWSIPEVPTYKDQDGILNSPCKTLPILDFTRVIRGIMGRAKATDLTKAKNWWDRTTKIFDKHQEIPSIQFSHRMAECFKIAPAVAEVLNFSPEEMLDALIVTKVLPWVRFRTAQFDKAKGILDECADRAKNDHLEVVETEIKKYLKDANGQVDYLR